MLERSSKHLVLRPGTRTLLLCISFIHAALACQSRVMSGGSRSVPAAVNLVIHPSRACTTCWTSLNRGEGPPVVRLETTRRLPWQRRSAMTSRRWRCKGAWIKGTAKTLYCRKRTLIFYQVAAGGTYITPLRRGHIDSSSLQTLEAALRAIRQKFLHQQFSLYIFFCYEESYGRRYAADHRFECHCGAVVMTRRDTSSPRQRLPRLDVIKRFFGIGHTRHLQISWGIRT